MRFSADAVVDHPVDRVYRVYRDALTEVAVEIANVERIEESARLPHPGGVEIANVWHGQGWIPRLVRHIIFPEMLVWDARVIWYDGPATCDWRITTRYFRECVDCHGTILFVAPAAGQTRITMQGRLDITLDSVTAIPARFRRRVAAAAERLLCGMVPPNLQGVAHRIDLHLRSATDAAEAPRRLATAAVD